MRRNFENFQTHLLNELGCDFSVIGVTETRIKTVDIPISFDIEMPNYNFERSWGWYVYPLNAGGVGMYIHNSLKYTVIERTSNEAFQALWIDISLPRTSNILCGVLYRQHNSPESFLSYFGKTRSINRQSTRSINSQYI